MNLQNATSRQRNKSNHGVLRQVLLVGALLVACGVGVQSTLAHRLVDQDVAVAEDNSVDGDKITKARSSQEKSDSNPEKTGKVTGIKYNCVHVMKLEKTLKLYREILGFKMDGASVLHGPGVEGMLVMELKAGDCKVFLSLPAPGGFGLKPIGNTNHNHFMLLVDNIVPICDKLKAEGYELENDNYARDKYSFFTGPNGEIVGLTEYK